MQNDLKLSDRKREILRAIIDSHITDGEPVGSKYLLKQCNFDFSSATIRNEMAELEEMGYLYQPHTSAGRVPTMEGYRFYVDSLMERYDFTISEIAELNDILRQRMNELDSILNTASRLVSSLTNYPTITIKRTPKQFTVHRFNTMFLDKHNFLINMLMDGETVKTKHISTTYHIDEDLLSRLVDVLQRKATYIPLEALTITQIMEMERELGDYDGIIGSVFKAVLQSTESENENEIKYAGVNRLLEYPEFSDMEKMKEVLEILEKKDTLLKFAEDIDKEKTKAVIGRNDIKQVSDNSALVFKTISYGGKVIGAIGVLGPCRMDYSKVITTLEYLSEKFAQEGTIEPESDNKP